LRLPSWIPQAFVTAGFGLMVVIIALKLVTSRFGKTQ
jgi:TRAP-type C4-dicarboxylate transport system permease small subunit